VAFSPDGTSLASGMENGMAMIWSLAPIDCESAKARAFTAKELERLWHDLGKADARLAYRAVFALAQAKSAAPTFLQERLTPILNESKRINQLISDLDDSQFAVRDKATRALEKLGRQAEPALRQALVKAQSAELRRRIETLLEPSAAWVVKDAETLRSVRAICVLERIATPEARSVLKNITQAHPETRTTQEARAALERLARSETKK